MTTQILIALAIGVGAAILDILPMLKNPMAQNKMYRFSIASVFCQWILLGLLIPFVRWDVVPWFKGFLIGFMGMIPTTILTYARISDYKISIRILVHGGVLGALVGMLGFQFIG